jgi:hypothetical protein
MAMGSYGFLFDCDGGGTPVTPPIFIPAPTCNGFGHYFLTPSSGPPDTLRDDYRFLCLDDSTSPDSLFYFADCPDQPGDHFFYYAGGTSKLFDAEVREGNTFTHFNGSTQRAFGGFPLTPFASGFYERYSLPDSVFLDSGSFTFRENGLSAGTRACTP